MNGAAGFTVITDHDTLRHFFRQRNLSTPHVQWLQVSAPYQRHMDIVFEKGAVSHVDALSRRPDVKNSLQKLQMLRCWTNDEAKCKLHAQSPPQEIRLHLDSRLHAEIRNAYDLDKYMFTRKSLPTSPVLQSNGLLYAYGKRMYVPDVSALRSRVLYELHDEPIAEHRGITRLLATITRTFWWPNMKQTVQHYVCTQFCYLSTQQGSATQTLWSPSIAQGIYHNLSNMYRLTCLWTYVKPCTHDQ
jgi:hypothetical protein